MGIGAPHAKGTHTGSSGCFADPGGALVVNKERTLVKINARIGAGEI